MAVGVAQVRSTWRGMSEAARYRRFWMASITTCRALPVLRPSVAIANVGAGRQGNKDGPEA